MKEAPADRRLMVDQRRRVNGRVERGWVQESPLVAGERGEKAREVGMTGAVYQGQLGDEDP